MQESKKELIEKFREKYKHLVPSNSKSGRDNVSNSIFVMTFEEFSDPKLREAKEKEAAETRKIIRDNLRSARPSNLHSYFGPSDRFGPTGRVAKEKKERLKEKKIIIKSGETGHTYENLLGDYLKGAREIVVEDPYVRMPHQIANFSRLCSLLLKLGDIKTLLLTTSFKDHFEKKQTTEILEIIKHELKNSDVEFLYEFIPHKHARNIICNNGWEIGIDRGLDIYQKPKVWNTIESVDYKSRPCLETEITIRKVRSDDG